MAVNPTLIQGLNGEIFPAPFPNEVFVLQRDGLEAHIDNLRTSNGWWKTHGSLYVSDVRVVFVANKIDNSGLQAFDIPLVYLRKEAFNQPIFGCNNLAGQVWPATEGGGPGGSLPPHSFKLFFLKGGCGTLVPLFFDLLKSARLNSSQVEFRNMQPTGPVPAAQDMANHAYVDPSDSSKIFLSQPVDESQRLDKAPKYATNYGEDEVYESMDPAHKR